MTKVPSEEAPALPFPRGSASSDSSAPPRGARPLPTRQRMLDAIRAHPGISVGELHARFGLAWSTLQQHVDLLVASGRVRSIRAGGRRLLLPVEAAGHERFAAARAILTGATVRAVAAAIAARPDARIQELVAMTGSSRRAVYYHVKHLVDEGIVTTNSTTRRFGLRATPLLRHVLEQRAADAGADGRAG